MKYSAVVATTRIDKQNMKFTKELLDKTADSINNGNEAVRMGLEHDIMIPPLGKTVGAKVERMEDDEYELIVTQELFNEHKKVSLPNGEIAYKQSLKNDRRPFVVHKYEETPGQIIIHTDYMNFNSKEEREMLLKEINEAGNIESIYAGRKSALPDPEILITLSHDAILYYVGYKVASKILNKVCDKIAEDVSQIYDVIKVSIIGMAKYAIPKNRPITYIMEVPGEPIIQLIVRTSDEKIALSSMQKDKVKSCIKRSMEIHEVFNTDEIQFIFNEKQEWEFNYLLTKNGEVIGTPDSFNRREKLIKTMYDKLKNRTVDSE